MSSGQAFKQRIKAILRETERSSYDYLDTCASVDEAKSLIEKQGMPEHSLERNKVYEPLVR